MDQKMQELQAQLRTRDEELTLLVKQIDELKDEIAALKLAAGIIDDENRVSDDLI